MAAPWSITNLGVSGAAATASLAAATGAATSNQTIRLRALFASVGGASAGADTLQVLDGGTVIYNAQLSIPANGFAMCNQVGLDLRATPGNNLTVAFKSGVAGSIESVSAQGDLIPAGLPYGSNSP